MVTLYVQLVQMHRGRVNKVLCDKHLTVIWLEVGEQITRLHVNKWLCTMLILHLHQPV